MIRTHLGIRKKLRKLISYKNLLLFSLRNVALGFEYANVFIKRVDKNSLLLILKKYGATIGINCDIESGQTFHNCKDYSNLKIGNNCHIGKNCFIDLHEKIEISDNVTIAMQCTLLTHEDFGKSSLNTKYLANAKSISIKNHAYIGAHSTILMGNIIGEYSIVAAGSVVNITVPSYSVVGGTPAKIIKKIELVKND